MANDDEKMLKLIEELSDEANSFKTYAGLQQELLRRVTSQELALDKDQRKDFEEKENIVFDRVTQHKLNGEKGLDTFAEQFKKVHGKEHQEFTEEWLLEQTGHAIELDNVLENPTFKDFVGTYKIWPMSAYIASKLTIDEEDFMGVFDLGSEKADASKTKATYEGVSVEKDFTAADKKELDKHEKAEEARIAKKEETLAASHEHAHESDDEGSTCCGSDAKVAPHALGDGEYVQFRLRKENVVQFLDNSYTANKLKTLIEADSPNNPKEPIYVFTASSNGIMRFHPWGGISRKLWHGYGDSSTTANFFKNIKHAGTYGCFCFGVIYKEKTNYTDKKTGHYREGGRTIVMRYNRWATDNHPIYCMVRKHRNDQSVPKQPTARSIFACCGCRDKDADKPKEKADKEGGGTHHD